jgi:polyisoprenoid-binding protein YceI
VLSQLVTVSLAAAALLAPTPEAPRAQTAKPAGAATWRIDVNHSELGFEVRHLVSRVRGTFNKWSGTVVADPSNWTSGRVEVTIDASTIDTNNERRDSDLRSSNFFAVDSFPTISFVSSRVEQSGDDITLHGTLTMRGVAKPVALKGKALGVVPDRNGKRRAGFEAEATINRLDYGITWNRVAEGGGAVLADDVKIEVVVALVEQ